MVKQTQNKVTMIKLDIAKLKVITITLTITTYHSQYILYNLINHSKNNTIVIFDVTVKSNINVTVIDKQERIKLKQRNNLLTNNKNI